MDSGNVFDRPGDIGSIPRDGKDRNLHDPEFTWERHVCFEIIPLAVNCNVFDRPVNLRSIPSDGYPSDEPDIAMERPFDSPEQDCGR